MAPPLIALLFVVVVVAVVAAVTLWGMRAGLWLKQTSPDAAADDPDRPVHVRVEDEADQRIVGT